MKEEIPRSSDSLSRKTQRLLNHEKGDPKWLKRPFSGELQYSPRGDPTNLCANTRIRLLATHSLVPAFETSLLRINAYFHRNESLP